MLFPETWPSFIQNYLHQSFGKPLLIEKLGGVVYDEGCSRIRFPGQSVIVKKTREPREWFLYKENSHFLEELGVNLPVLYNAYTNKDEYWLVLENIPSSLPKAQWEANPSVLKVLFSLHFGTWEKELPLKYPFTPKWNDEMSATALACFPDRLSLHIKPMLDLAKEHCQPIFQPLCWISGDPNPTNWGLRKDGKVILFDWERVGFGHPAIDLAITIPGLGSSDGSLESLIAKRYLAMWNSTSIEFPFTVQELTNQIRLAKIWSVVEFLADNSELFHSDRLNSIVNQFPEKLKALHFE